MTAISRLDEPFKRIGEALKLDPFVITFRWMD
jgi:hypothetical protein